jgi:hypothetical protein
MSVHLNIIMYGFLEQKLKTWKQQWANTQSWKVCDSEESCNPTVTIRLCRRGKARAVCSL